MLLLFVIFVAVKVGIPEFLNGIGKGVEAHVTKLESEIGDFHKLLVTRTLKLKKLGIPCQQVIILNPQLNLHEFFFFKKKIMHVCVCLDSNNVELLQVE
jgi:hypothetical protein